MKKLLFPSLASLVLLLAVNCSDREEKENIQQQKLDRSAEVRDSLEGEIVFANVFCGIRKVAARIGDIGTELSYGNCQAVPKWSPDGLKIAFVIQKPGQQSTMYDWYLKVIDSNGAPLNEWIIEPSLNAVLSLTWSPDGSVIALLMDNSRILYVKTLTGQITATPLPTGTEEYYQSIAWSPSGKIAVSMRTGITSPQYKIMLFDAYGNDPRTGITLVENTASDIVEVNHMDWSPDGTKLAYSGRTYNSIWIVGSDGSDNHELMLSGIFRDEEVRGYSPSWSANNKQIIFTGNTGIIGSTFVYGLFVTDINGSYKVDLQIPGETGDWH